MKNQQRFLSGAACLALACTATTGWAQAPAPSGEGEIVVTAQRRSERLTDVPMSITALSSDSLAKAGINNTAELGKAVPGVAMTFYGSFLQPAVRGVTSTGANLGENSNVAMYIDGVYQPQQIATLVDLPDVQQVEVLKGPQGALYGQNATGGAILVTSMTPSFDLTGKFSASYGNFNAINLRGYVSGPITDKIAFSLSGGFQDRDGFRRHVITGERDLGLNAKVVRGKLLFDFSEAAKITVTGYYSDRRDSSMYAGFALGGNSLGYAANLATLLGPVGAFLPIPASPKVSDTDQFSTNAGVFTRIKSYGGNIRGEFDVGAGTITSTTAVTRNRVTYLADADFTAVDLVEATAGLNGAYFTQELTFASKKMGPVSFLLGGFYLNGNETFIHNRSPFYVPSLPPTPKTLLFASDQNARVDKEIFAGYAEVTVEATDRLTITAGGRYTNEKQRAFSDQIIDPATGAQQKYPYLLEYPGDPVTFQKFTPRITARYEITPNANIYASWGKGFKSGVVNTTDFSITPVRPEVITAYEVGFKGRVADGLRVNLSGFYYDYKDLQSVIFVPGKAYITQNAASARIKGVEMDLSWTPIPHLTLSGGATFLDGKYRNFQGAANYVPTGIGHVASTVDLSGKRMLRAPEFSGNAAISYDLDTSAGRFGAFASVYHTSSFGMEATNRIVQKAYTTLDGEISFTPEGIKGLRVALWGKNLTNKAYLASILVAGGVADGGSYAEPRTYGVRAEFAF